MVSFGDIGSTLNTVIFAWLKTGLFWVALLLFLGVMILGYLYMRKRKKLVFPCHIETEMGDGKIGRKVTSAGYFKDKWAIFNLYDYGSEEKLFTKEGVEIRLASSYDFHDLNGKRGIICARSPTDPKILLPISRVKLDAKSQDMLLSLAPADFRDASVDIYNKTKKEMSGFMEKYGTMIIFAGLIVFSLISILLITQMVQKGQDKAENLILQAGDLVKTVANQLSIIKSQAP